ncbi:hypothetical protein FH972_021951 [Carpinus fangiana]|uniref:CMP/dCMP-type deaminase domain-containing protein n=1 Tax=Carpinus fangiana TaxID=176857 RepID=A0A5N6KQT6_9ROSI|nr:hypothetical protein FH972_021951 [Carpinus fangiana]
MDLPAGLLESLSLGGAEDHEAARLPSRRSSPRPSLTQNAVSQAPMFGPIENRPYHEAFMREAINMAETALRTDETPVGCVFVHSATGTIIGRGMNDTNRSMNGTRHAEFVAIEQILAEHPQSIFTETDLYVTVEPCIMCASALRQYGIKAVYYGCANDKFGGTGGVMNVHSDWSVNPPYPVHGGLFREEAIMLLRRFYVQENDKAPEPHRKGTRELKTEILPITSPSPKPLTQKPIQAPEHGPSSAPASAPSPNLSGEEKQKPPSLPLADMSNKSSAKRIVGPIKPALPRRPTNCALRQSNVPSGSPGSLLTRLGSQSSNLSPCPASLQYSSLISLAFLPPRPLAPSLTLPSPRASSRSSMLLVEVDEGKGLRGKAGIVGDVMSLGVATSYIDVSAGTEPRRCPKVKGKAMPEYVDLAGNPVNGLGRRLNFWVASGGWPIPRWALHTILCARRLPPNSHLHLAVQKHSTSEDHHTRIMDAPEPEQSPFQAVSAQTSRVGRIYQSYLDKSTPFTAYRWAGTGVLLLIFGLRIIVAQGWYIVAYSLGIYLLNLFLAFLSPKFDPSLEQDENMESGGDTGVLPTKNDQEFRPFVRRLPEFKFWHAATRAIAIGFLCSWFAIFDIPVFWPVLVLYWLILFALTNPAHDQVPLCPIHRWQAALQELDLKGKNSLQRCSMVWRKELCDFWMLQRPGNSVDAHLEPPSHSCSPAVLIEQEQPLPQVECLNETTGRKDLSPSSNRSSTRARKLLCEPNGFRLTPHHACAIHSAIGWSLLCSRAHLALPPGVRTAARAPQRAHLHWPASALPPTASNSPLALHRAHGQLGLLLYVQPAPERDPVARLCQPICSHPALPLALLRAQNTAHTSFNMASATVQLVDKVRSIDPIERVVIALLVVGTLVGICFTHSFGPKGIRNAVDNSVGVYWRFAYNCFFKPHGTKGSRNQQDALESFYKAQATVYDATRERLLRGRKEMLGMCAAQLKQRLESGSISTKPIWVDVGGGTGYNIEKMAKYVDVPTYFSKVYLVDFSPSLCEVAEARFQRLGWKNVHVVCADARHFRLEDHEAPSTAVARKSSTTGAQKLTAELLTMSYSLSMIPEFYPVIDSLSSLLGSNGVIGVADFYVQSEIDYQSRNYTGGEIDRHCMWISRVFWRTWFEQDRVSLEAARRDYLEYRFGTVLQFNARCQLLGFRIPYYVWVGCSKDDGASQLKLAKLNAAATESPFLSALDVNKQLTGPAHDNGALEVRSKAYESAVINLAASLPLPAAWYQAHHWRIYYDDQLQKHRQFNDEYIYAFTWEDARVDARLLNIKSDDVILAITSAGDNVLAYALERPKRIHAIDLNPSQNHLLELKLAAFTALGYDDVWALFGEGKHANFREVLISKLSPHLSSAAFQFWLRVGEKTFGAAGKGLAAREGGACGDDNYVETEQHVPRSGRRRAAERCGLHDPYMRFGARPSHRAITDANVSQRCSVVCASGRHTRRNTDAFGRREGRWPSRLWTRRVICEREHRAGRV